jgi:hypothetical protein
MVLDLFWSSLSDLSLLSLDLYLMVGFDRF